MGPPRPEIQLQPNPGAPAGRPTCLGTCGLHSLPVPSDVVKRSNLLSYVGRCGPAAGQLGVVFWARFVGSDGRFPR
jgi:hypothetical protein